jgi:dCTP diphosphatase
MGGVAWNACRTRFAPIHTRAMSDIPSPSDLPNDSIRELTARIQSFVDAREWRRYHNPKDLSVAIAAEAGELMQHFVWQQDAQIVERVAARREEIASEIADVGILLFELADNLGFRLGEIMEQKIARNEIRYPVEKSRGNNLKYSEL